MVQVLEKNNNGSKTKAARFIAPEKLARDYSHGPTSLLCSKARNGNAAAHKRTSGSEILQGQARENRFANNRRITAGLPSHTLVMHFGEDQYTERNFTEDKCFLDIVKICEKFVDIHAGGVIITDKDGMLLRNDKDLVLMLKKNGNVERIDIDIDVDDDMITALQNNPTYDSVPIVDDITLTGDFRVNEKVVVHASVINGTVRASTVQFFSSVLKNYESENCLRAISECMINKGFQIPFEAVGHFLVAKLTPMCEDGECGEPRYTISHTPVEDVVHPKANKLRGKNKNKKIARLQRGDKLEISFYNNRAVGDNHKCWSRNLGIIVRDKNICPVRLMSWKDLTDANKDHMWNAVKESFYNVNIDLYRGQTLEHMRDLWTSGRSTLNKEFVKPCKTRTDVLNNVPQGIDTEDWEWLASNKFLSDKFQETSKRNCSNRVNGTMPHRTGSKPHRQFIYEKGGKEKTHLTLLKFSRTQDRRKESLLRLNQKTKMMIL